MNTRKSAFSSLPGAIPLAILALGTLSPAFGANNIPDTPLQANTSAEPNIVLILDDSGSMQYEVMPESDAVYFTFPRANPLYGANWGYGSRYDTVARFNEDNRYARYFRTAQYNTLYYNPKTRYLPWVKADGSRMPDSPPTAACHNPDKCSGTTSEGTLDLTHGHTWTVPWRNDDGSESSVKRTFYPATFFTYVGATKLTGPTDGNNLQANFVKTEIRSATPNYTYQNAPNRTDCSVSSNGTATCPYDKEIQNFANWYTYYRSRILTARAGIGAAFADQGEKIRVGFAAINHGSTNVDGKNRSTLISGVRLFSGTDRTKFFSSLYGHVMPSAGTPLRKALDDIGKYYQQTDDLGPWSSTPGVAGGTPLACRQSYSILMTDGYWNSDAASTPANGDNDSSAIAEITGPNGRSFTQVARSPFKDGRSNTLADVAAYYWKTDLATGTGFENVVPTTTRDPAFWQHMVTFGVGFGVTGKQDPTQAFAAIDDTSIKINWDDPNNSDSAKIDDLLHAAVNSRGDFLSAGDPDVFAAAMKAMLDNITQRQSSAASVSTNSTKLTTSSLVFSAKFNTSKWTGELEAFTIGNSGVSDTAKWKASEKLPAHGSRKILTTTGGQVKEFLWSNLSTTDQSALGSADVVSFIRGDRSKEVANGGTLRNRGSALGDIVHSSPYYSKDSKIVLVGANDGMLHAFDADTGVEKFAYIPSPLLAKLAQLSQTSYDHKYFVDGEIAVGEKSQTFLKKSYAVAPLGRGGKGLFALDITDPANFGTSNVAWEYVSTTDKDLGYMLGKPVIARMNDDSTVAIVGNGYNSTDGNAVLYIFDLEKGTLLAKISTNVGGDNGLATPGVYDEDADGYVDYIYAGDLKGNVWKFDVADNNKNQWKLDNGGAPIFVAKDAAGKLQPITSQITMARNFLRNDPNLGKLFLFFGTGAYFRADDPASKAVQSWYGIIDDKLTISSRNVLKQRGLESVFTVEGKTVRSFKPAKIVFDNQGNLVSHDMNGERGWYIDWIDPDGTERGERIITPSAFYRFTEPVLLVSSIVPVADDPCQPGGTGYLNAINAFTGGSLSESFFIFGSYTGATAIGSLDMDLGMLSQASILVGDSSTGQLVVSGSGKTGATDEQTTGSTKVNTGVQPRGRMSWREIRK